MSVAAAGVAAAIFAGGHATRMRVGGGDDDIPVSKGLLVVDGRRIIDRQLEVLRPLFAEVFVVANDPAPWSGLGLRVVADRVAQRIGPLAGLDAALAALPDRIDAVVCVASDMPFLAPGLLTLLRDAAPRAMAVVPRVGGRPEPLLARYARSAAPIVEQQIARADHALVRLLAQLSVSWLDEDALRAVDAQLRSIVNVNTSEDLARLQRRDG